jgi:hypothetical protein
LFWQTKRHGALRTPAKFIPEWKSLLDVPPSPKKHIETTSSPLIRAAIAVPAAWMICVPMGLEIDTNLWSA